MMQDLYNDLTIESSLFDILNFNLALQKIICYDRHHFTYMRGKTSISSLLLLLLLLFGYVCVRVRVLGVLKSRNP